MKKVYINRQWQGGADPVARDGAEEIANLYLAGQDHVDLPVSADMTAKENGIRGFDVLRRQMRSAYERLRGDAPDRLFTLGVYEYAPAGSKNAFMERLVRFGLAL